MVIDLSYLNMWLNARFPTPAYVKHSIERREFTLITCQIESIMEINRFLRRKKLCTKISWYKKNENKTKCNPWRETSLILIWSFFLST